MLKNAAIVTGTLLAGLIPLGVQVAHADDGSSQERVAVHPVDPAEETQSAHQTSAIGSSAALSGPALMSAANTATSMSMMYSIYGPMTAVQMIASAERFIPFGAGGTSPLPSDPGIVPMAAATALDPGAAVSQAIAPDLYGSTLPGVDASTLLPGLDVSSLLPALDASTLGPPDLDVSTLLPGLDVSSLLPALDASTLGLPDLDVSSLLPALDASTLIPDLDVSTLIPDLDISTLVPDLSSLVSGLDIMPGLDILADFLAAWI